MSSNDLNTQKRVLVACASISGFILGAILFQFIFNFFQMESISSTIMSIVGGTIIAWIILMMSGILKEFTIKGGSFELSSKLKEVQDELKTSNTEICGKINNLNQNFLTSSQNLNNRIDTVVTNISNNNASAETKIVHNYLQTQGEFKAMAEDSGVTNLEVKKEISLSKNQQTKMDEILTRLKTLEGSMDQPIQLTVDEKMRRANYDYYKENYEEAKTAYEEILKENPKDTTAMFNLAYCNSQLNNLNKALSLYNKILEIEIDDAAVLNNIGLVYSKKLDAKKAVEYYRRSVKADPNDNLQRVNLANQLRVQGKYDEALDVLSEAEKNNAIDMTLLSEFSLVYAHSRNEEKSKEYAKKVLELTPETRNEEVDHVICNIILGNYSKASELSEQLLDKYGEKSDILYNYACVKALQNQKKEAIEFLRKAIVLSPRYLLSIKTDPDFDKIRDSVEFQELLS